MSNELSIKFAEEYGWSEKETTIKEWAEKYGVCVNTIINWKKENQTVISNIINERRKEIANSVIVHSKKALDKIVSQIDSEDEKIAQNASEIILDKTIIPEQTVNVNERVKPEFIVQLSNNDTESVSKTG